MSNIFLIEFKQKESLSELTEKETIKLNLHRKNNFDLDWLPPAVCQSKAPLLGAGTSGTET